MKRLYLVRGLPGTGKSSTAEMIAPGSVFSADDYFEKGDLYDFKASELKSAHADCLNRVKSAMAAGETPLAVANTLSTRTEAEPYYRAAADAGYTVAVIECQTVFGNVHGVPADTVDKMRGRWESIVIADDQGTG